MERQDILALYEWLPGICFRHPERGEVATTHVKTIRPAAGGIQDVRACHDCIVAIEERRAAVAERQGEPYSPGHIGDVCDDE